MLGFAVAQPNLHFLNQQVLLPVLSLWLLGRYAGYGDALANLVH